MTGTANIQMDGNMAIQKTNTIEEDGTIRYRNDNIKMVTRLSNAFRLGNISKLIAGAALGLALPIGLAMPGAASTDVPSGSVSSSIILNDDFSMVYGIPDTGLELAGVSNSVLARVMVYPESMILDDNFSMVY